MTDCSHTTSLKKFRTQHHLNQGEFAAKIHYSRSVIAQIERGRGSGTVDFWTNVQEAFNVSDEDMWKLIKGRF